VKKKLADRIDIRVLISLAGSRRRLAQMLGVREHSITDWIRFGRVSRTGALLIGRSQIVGKYVGIDLIRPDLTDHDRRQIGRSKRFIEARKKQLIFESRSDLGYDPIPDLKKLLQHD